MVDIATPVYYVDFASLANRTKIRVAQVGQQIAVTLRQGGYVKRLPLNGTALRGLDGDIVFSVDTPGGMRYNTWAYADVLEVMDYLAKA